MNTTTSAPIPDDDAKSYMEDPDDDEDSYNDIQLSKCETSSAKVSRGPTGYRFFYKNPMLEVFSVRIHFKDASDHLVRLCGTIKASDSYYDTKGPCENLYKREKEDPEYVSTPCTHDILLIGPSSQAYSASAHFGIFLDLRYNDGDLFDLHYGLISWDVVLRQNHYDKLIHDNVKDVLPKNVSVIVDYAVFSDAIQATIEVVYVKAGCHGGHHDLVNVYGLITARSSKFRKGKSVLFSRKKEDHVKIKFGDLIPLSRSIVAVPCESYLIVEAELNDDQNNAIVNGQVVFRARSSGLSEMSISSDNGEIQIKITWV